MFKRDDGTSLTYLLQDIWGYNEPVNRFNSDDPNFLMSDNVLRFNGEPSIIHNSWEYFQYYTNITRLYNPDRT